jgi:carbon-monoxide dehydrogenase medium subunit
MKARILRYAHLIDLKRIVDLSRIRCEGDTLVIGALATHFRIASDPLVTKLLPAYSRLSDGIANIRVRVAGTIGGNLCFAEPHADPPALLAAYGASITLASPEGSRSVPVGQFILGEFTTERADREILTAVTVPVPPSRARFAYQNFGYLERPAVGVAAGCIPGPHGFTYRVWVGAISDRPIQVVSMEQALEGVPPEGLGDVLPTTARAAAASLPATDDLYGSADYKRHLASVLLRRVVLIAAGQSAGDRNG